MIKRLSRISFFSVYSKQYLVTKHFIFRQFIKQRLISETNFFLKDQLNNTCRIYSTLSRDNLHMNLKYKQSSITERLNSGFSLDELKEIWISKYRNPNRLEWQDYFEALILFQDDLSKDEIKKIHSLIEDYISPISLQSPLIRLLSFKLFIEEEAINVFSKAIIYDIKLKLLVHFIIFNSIFKNQSLHIENSFLFKLETGILNLLGILEFKDIYLPIRLHYFTILCSSNPIGSSYLFKKWFPNPSLKELHMLLNLFYHNTKELEARETLSNIFFLDPIPTLIDELIRDNIHMQNIPPDSELCDKLLIYLITNDFIDEVESWLYHISRFDRGPSSLFVNKAINILKKNSEYRLAFRLFDVISEIGYKLDPITYFSVIDTMSESKQSSQVTLPLVNRTIDRFHQSLKKDNLEDNEKTNLFSCLSETDKISYFNCILKYSLSIRDSEIFETVLSQIKEGKDLIMASEHTFGMLIREYSTKHQFDEMEYTLKQMTEKFGYTPTKENYFYIIRAYQEKNSSNMSYKHLNEMVNHYNLQPTPEIYHLFNKDDQIEINFK